MSNPNIQEWIVWGAERETGEERALRIEARTREEAVESANARGIAVAGCAPVPKNTEKEEIPRSPVERLSTLEAELRRAKVRGRWAAAGGTATLAATVIIATLALILSIAESRGFEEIRVERLVMMDSGGSERARFVGADSDGDASIVLSDTGGAERLRLTSGGLQIADGHGAARISLAIGANGPGLSISDEKGDPRVRLLMDGDVPRLRLLDEGGIARVGLAIDDTSATGLAVADRNGTTCITLASDDNDTWLNLYGKAESAIEITATSNGPVLDLIDDDGDPRITLDVSEEGPLLTLLGDTNEYGVVINVDKHGSLMQLTDAKSESVIVLAAADKTGTTVPVDEHEGTETKMEPGVWILSSRDASGLLIIDGKGSERINLLTNPNGTGLAVANGDGGRHMAIRTDSEGFGPSLSVTDDQGAIRAILAIGEDGPILNLLDENMQHRASIGMNRVTILDDQGKVRLGFGVHFEMGPWIELYNEEGQVIEGMP